MGKNSQKAFRKGHKYMTVVNDLTRGRVLYVAEDRKRESLDGFWGTLTDSQRAGIEAVAMDMWDPYVTSCWRVLYIIEDRPSW
jgi:transposase